MKSAGWAKDVVAAVTEAATSAVDGCADEGRKCGSVRRLRAAKVAGVLVLDAVGGGCGEMATVTEAGSASRLLSVLESASGLA